MNKNNKIAIITGITSFLGRSTAKKLIKEGFIVFGIARKDSLKLDEIKDIEGLNTIYLDFDNFNLKEFGNISNAKTLEFIEKIKEFDADITFIHYGWAATLDRNNFMLQMFNIDYSKKVLEFARMIGAKRFVFAGSQAELSESAYGMAKKEFAKIAKPLINLIHIRIYSIYGVGDRDTSLIMSLIKAIKENKDIDLSSCKQKWNFLYIDDYVNMLYKLIINDVKAGIYDMGSDDTRQLKSFVKEAYDVLGGKNKLNFGARPDSTEKFSIPNITKTLNEIGEYKFIPFSKGVKMIWNN